MDNITTELEFDIFKLMEEVEEATEQLPKEKAPDSEQKSKEVSKKSKSSTKKTETVDEDIICPIIAVTPYGNFSIGEDKIIMKASEVVDELIQNYGFNELKSCYTDIFINNEIPNTVFMTFHNLVATKENTIVHFGEDGESAISVCFGLKQSSYHQNSFDELISEGIEVSVGDLCDKFVEENPEFEGCSLAYDPYSGIAIPIGTLIDISSTNAKFSSSFELGSNSGLYYDSSNFNEKEEISMSEFLDYYIENDVNAIKSFRKDIAINKMNSFILPFIHLKSNAVHNKETYKLFKTIKSAEREESYKLPFSVFFIFREPAHFTSSDFEGKNRVTLKDVSDKISECYRAFKEKPAKLTYIAEENCFEALSYTGTKG